MGRAVDPASPHLHDRYRPWRAYGQAKLANFHFGLGLQRELEKAGVSTASLIAHPGLSNTGLQAVSVQESGDRRARGGGGMTVAPKDRAAAVRSALRTLVARNGFHGASMSAVASQAGVATGTAYTHYASKDELVLAAYCETKAQLGAAAVGGLDAGAEAGTQFRGVWLAAYLSLPLTCQPANLPHLTV